MDKVWFYTGTEMKDGTKRTMGAIDEAQVKEYEKKGLVRVEKDEPEVIDWATIDIGSVNKNAITEKANELKIEFEANETKAQILSKIQEAL